MTSLYIQVPAFEEAHKLPKTMRDIGAQQPPEDVSVTYQAWVTRSEDRRGMCPTWQAAQMVPGWEVREAPAGKLSARNAAHTHAAEAGADLICSWDADAPPLNEEVLYSLVQTARADGVVLANSNPVGLDGSIIGTVSFISSRVEDRIIPHVHGQCHIMTTEAWQHAGPFDTDLDQTHLGEVRSEEEFGFRKAVSEVGEVVDVPEAEVFNDPRRTVCRLPGYGEGDDFCTRRGDNTF